MKPINLFARLGLAVTVAAACGTAVAADPIRIGVPVGLSGANSVVAPAVVQSSQLAVDEINAAGGILGRQLVLEIADDGSGAVGAQKAYDTLLFQKKVDVVIGMETSAARNAALPILNRARVPFIYTSFYEGRSCNRWMHVNGWVPEQQVAPVVDHFMKAEQAKTFFLVGSDYAFGRGMLKFTRDYITAQGGKVVGEEYLPMDGSDWTAIVSRIRSVKPDALISSTAGGSPNVSLAKQIQAAGLKMPYGNLAIDEGTARTMGATAAGMYVSASYLTGIDNEANKKYLAGLQAKFGAEAKTANELSEPQYEAFYLYKAAAEKAGSTDAKEIVEALSQVSYDGPRGVVSMSKQRHAALSMRLGQVQQDGSIKILQTFEAVDPGEQCPKLD